MSGSGGGHAAGAGGEAGAGGGTGHRIPAFDTGRFARALTQARMAPVADAPLPATAEDASFPLGTALLSLPRVGSTQEEARALVRAGAPHGTIVLAEEQSAGRGRRGRTWVSPPGTGIWATVILRRGLPGGAPQGLTLAGAVAVCDAARALGADVAIKWPNDVIAPGGKVAGVLGEMLAADAGPCALLGLGVNYDWTAAGGATGIAGAGDAPTAGPPGFAGEATDLRAAGLCAEVGREELLAAIVVRLEAAAAAAGSGRLADVLDRWRALSPSSSGRRVRVTETGGDPVSGTTRGIAPDGSLLVEDDGGVTHIVRFGGTLRFEASGRRNADAADH